MAKTAKIKKASNRRYVLELSEKQAQALTLATELYARLGMGQFDKLDHFFFWKPQESLTSARRHLDALTMIKNESVNSYPGIHSRELDDDFRVLWDLYQVIRHRLAWDRNPNQKAWGGVDDNDPLRTSKKEPLARIEQLSGKTGSFRS